MKKGDVIYCIDESVYDAHITKRNSYIIEKIDQEKSQVRVKNNSQKLVWLPNLCFNTEKTPDIISINIDDEIENPAKACIEVTIHFSNGDRRFITFMTLLHLQDLFNEFRDFVNGNRLILVEKVTPELIYKTIDELDRQNELMESSLPY